MPAEARVALFVDTEQRLTWTSLLFDELPDAEAYLVGGTVRDILLGHLPNDIDLVVRNVEHDALERWLSRHGAVSFTQSRFGTFKFTPHGCRKAGPIDIALPRVEAIGDDHRSGRRDLAITSNHLTSIGEDLSRRDFTINALAYNIQTGELLDPFFGLNDLDIGMIRTVLNPHERFFEDATRMLRALRLSSQLGFAIDGDAWQGILTNIHLLNNTRVTDQGTHVYVTPRESIGKEFLLGFVHHPIHTVELWEEAGALNLFLPDVVKLMSIVEPDGQTAWDKTKLILHTLKNPEFVKQHGLTRASANVLVAALGIYLDDAPTNTYAACKKLHFHQFPSGHAARVDCQTVVWLLHNLHLLEETDPASMRPSHFERLFCTQRGRELLLLMHARHFASGKHSAARERVHTARRIAGDYLREGARKHLITGTDIAAQGLAPGPEYRELIDQVRDAQLARRVENRQEAVALLRELINS